MGEPFIGEIRIFPYSYAPRGWAFCNGAIISITQQQTLFSVIGTAFGGDGQTTFGLPDFRGRAPVHWGDDWYGSHYVLGERGGSEFIQLAPNHMPEHTHRLVGTTNAANIKLVDNPSMLAKTVTFGGGENSVYGTPPTNPTKLQMSMNAIKTVGQNQAHENRQPSLTLNFCIALTGVYPSKT